MAIYDVNETSRLDTFFGLNVRGETSGDVVITGVITAEPGGTASK